MVRSKAELRIGLQGEEEEEERRGHTEASFQVGEGGGIVLLRFLGDQSQPVTLAAVVGVAGQAPLGELPFELGDLRLRRAILLLEALQLLLGLEGTGFPVDLRGSEGGAKREEND